MSFLDLLGRLALAAASLGFFALQTALIAGAVRRVLGVPVGWVRTIAVSFVLMAAMSGLIGLSTTQLIEYEQTFTPVSIGIIFVIAFLWGFALAAMALVVLEILVPSGSLPSWRVLTDLPQRWRRGRRYFQITMIMARHGLTSRFRGIRRSESDGHRTARALASALEEGGATFIKLGQMLSTRADLIPPNYVRELARLQDDAAPQSWDLVEAEIEAHLGRPLNEAFSTVDSTPLAAASLAQVHAAELPDGRPVVIKVQRPGARERVEVDLDILLRIASSLEDNAAWARQFGVLALARGFAESLLEELDYRIEVDNMEAVRAPAERTGVRIPKVEADLCRESLIVMERFDGTPVGRAQQVLADWDPRVRAEAAQTLLRSVLVQITGDGVFHADLHGGNVFCWPDGTVGLLDFGSVGRLDAVSRRNLAMVLWAIDADDPVLATDSLVALLDRPEHLDDRALQRAVGALMTRFRGGLNASGTSAVFSELFELVVAHQLGVPPSVAAALRCLAALEGTVRLLDADVDVVGAARAMGRAEFADFDEDRLRRELSLRAMHLLPVLDALPRRLDKITEDLERGRFTMNLRVFGHPEDRAFIVRVTQQLVTSVLASAAVLGAILLVVNGGGPVLGPGLDLFSVLGYLLGFAGFVLAVRAVALIYGPGTRQQN